MFCLSFNLNSEANGELGETKLCDYLGVQLKARALCCIYNFTGYCVRFKFPVWAILSTGLTRTWSDGV